MLFIIKRGRCKTEDCHSKAHYAEVAMAIRISDGMFTNNGGGAKEFANIDFPELGKEYPELYILKSATSSYSLYARYLKNFELYNICVGYKKKDNRPKIVCKILCKTVLLTNTGIFTPNARGSGFEIVQVLILTKTPGFSKPSCIDVDGLEIDKFKAEVADGVEAGIFKEVKNLNVYHSPIPDQMVRSAKK